jgi:GT2 family glycosyltransferase
MTSPSIAVIIVNWNSRDEVLASIRSLTEQADSELGIVVVDNGSDDDSVSSIRSRYPEVRVLSTGENLGFAEGCNRGMAETESEWLFLLNNDAMVGPDCVARLRAAAREALPDVGMIQTRLVFRHRPDRMNSSGVLVFRNGAARDRHFAEPVDAALEPGEVFCASAGAALYRRTMLEQVRTPSGYFDRRFFMYLEDVDLGWRCRLAGWRAVYVPEAVVLHRYQASASRRGSHFATKLCRMNRIHTLLKNASIGLLARGLPRTLMDLLKLTVRGGPAVLWQLVRELPGSLRERRVVEQLARLDRRALEQRWMTTPFFRAPRLELSTASGSPSA